MGNVRQIEHLIIQTAFVGDLLLGIPLLKELRRLKPQDRLVLLCRKGLGSFLVQARIVDEAIEFDKSDGSTSSSWANVKKALRKREFGLLICPHESPRTRFLVRSLRAERKIGYTGFLNFLVFDDRVKRPIDLPEALRQIALLEPLEADWSTRLNEFRAAQREPGGVATAEVRRISVKKVSQLRSLRLKAESVSIGTDSSFDPSSSSGGDSNSRVDLNVSLSEVPTWASMELASLSQLHAIFRETEAEFLKSRLTTCGVSEKLWLLINELDLNRNDRIAILAPGSVWPTKMWTSEGYRETARALLHDGFRVLLTGAPNEVEICKSIEKEVPGVVSIAGRTDLFESAQILSFANLLICNDSGAMHLAAAAGVPTVSIFGPTVLKFGYRPWQNRAKVESVALSCRPCGKHGAVKCPIGTHDCMKKVDSERVVNAARNLLQPKQRQN